MLFYWSFQMYLPFVLSNVACSYSSVLTLVTGILFLSFVALNVDRHILLGSELFIANFTFKRSVAGMNSSMELKIWICC
jgi:hypothetical protein